MIEAIRRLYQSVVVSPTPKKKGRLIVVEPNYAAVDGFFKECHIHGRVPPKLCMSRCRGCSYGYSLDELQQKCKYEDCFYKATEDVLERGTNASSVFGVKEVYRLKNKCAYMSQKTQTSEKILLMTHALLLKSSVGKNDVIFVDEAHLMPRACRDAASIELTLQNFEPFIDFAASLDFSDGMRKRIDVCQMAMLMDILSVFADTNDALLAYLEDEAETSNNNPDNKRKASDDLVTDIEDITKYMRPNNLSTTEGEDDLSLRIVNVERDAYDPKGSSSQTASINRQSTTHRLRLPHRQPAKKGMSDKEKEEAKRLRDRKHVWLLERYLGRALAKPKSYSVFFTVIRTGKYSISFVCHAESYAWSQVSVAKKIILLSGTLSLASISGLWDYVEYPARFVEFIVWKHVVFGCSRYATGAEDYTYNHASFDKKVSMIAQDMWKIHEEIEGNTMVVVGSYEKADKLAAELRIQGGDNVYQLRKHELNENSISKLDNRSFNKYCEACESGHKGLICVFPASSGLGTSVNVPPSCTDKFFIASNCYPHGESLEEQGRRVYHSSLHNPHYKLSLEESASFTISQCVGRAKRTMKDDKKQTIVFWGIKQSLFPDEFYQMLFGPANAISAKMRKMKNVDFRINSYRITTTDIYSKTEEETAGENQNQENNNNTDSVDNQTETM